MTVGDRLEYLLRRRWRDEGLPFGGRQIRGGLTKGERRLLYALARDYVEEDAAIVDAGCFLGASTAAFLSGLRDRRDSWKGRPLESYDFFRVEPHMIPTFFGESSVRIGDSFRPQFDANVSGFGVPHRIHQGDIVDAGWSGGPIDVLFLDVLKTWEVNDAVLRDFFPALQSGRSVIVHQDYGSGWAPWIPITVELMGGSLRLIDGMESGSHLFFLQNDIPEELMSDGVSGLDEATKFELVNQSIERCEAWVRGLHELARTELIYERDGTGAALQDLARIAEEYADYNVVVSFAARIRRELDAPLKA